MSIGERIKAERKRLGMSQETLSKAAGIAETTISGLENNRQQSTTALVRLAAVFNVRAEWIETGKGPKEAEPVESHPARLTGQMIFNAYRTATRVIEYTGLPATDFDPANRIKDADILARAILAQMYPSEGDEHV